MAEQKRIKHLSRTKSRLHFRRDVSSSTPTLTQRVAQFQAFSSRLTLANLTPDSCHNSLKLSFEISVVNALLRALRVLRGESFRAWPKIVADTAPRFC